MLTGVAHVLIVLLLAGAGIALGLWRTAVRLGARAGARLGPHVERRTGRIGRTGLDRGVEAAISRVAGPLIIWAAVLSALALLLAVTAWDSSETPVAGALGLVGATVALRWIPRLADVRLRRRSDRRQG